VPSAEAAIAAAAINPAANSVKPTRELHRNLFVESPKAIGSPGAGVSSSCCRDLERSHSMRMNRGQIAIMRRSCSDSPLTASHRLDRVACAIPLCCRSVFCENVVRPPLTQARAPDA
jgi:hypothetical protein